MQSQSFIPVPFTGESWGSLSSIKMKEGGDVWRIFCFELSWFHLL